MRVSHVWALLLIWAVAACSSPAPSATPTQPIVSQPPSVGPSATPGATPSGALATPSPALPATPAPTAQPRQGLGWTAIALPDIGEPCCYQIAAGDSGFLIFGGMAGDGTPTLLVSTDGVDWQAVDTAPWPAGAVDQIASWDGRFLAAGVSGADDTPHVALWTSDDGRSWQTLPDSAVLALPPDHQGNRRSSVEMLDAEDGRIVVVGESWPDPCVEGCDGPTAVVEWTSTDRGESWLKRKRRTERQNHFPPVHIGSRWVRVSQYWDVFETSPDQENWETARLPTDAYYIPSRVRLTPFGVVAVGAVGDYDAGLVLNSTDGVTWIQSVGWPDLQHKGKINDVAANDTTLVGIGFIYSGSTPKPYAFVSPPID